MPDLLAEISIYSFILAKIKNTKFTQYAKSKLCVFVQKLDFAFIL